MAKQDWSNADGWAIVRLPDGSEMIEAHKLNEKGCHARTSPTGEVRHWHYDKTQLEALLQRKADVAAAAEAKRAERIARGKSAISGAAPTPKSKKG